MVSTVDTSLFVRKIGLSITYLLLYVDDIIVTGNDPSYIETLIDQLRQKFDMTNLGALKYFIGLEVIKTNVGISVTQTKYAKDILHRFGMSDCKPCNTPIAINSFNDVSNSVCSLEDAKAYREIVGALHYITFTRADIAFSVSKLSQFMHCPAHSHLTAAKRVLSYINDTISKGILF